MSTAKALEPIYNYMKKELLNRNYIHADKTALKVINDNGKSSKSKKHMWLYMSETDAKQSFMIIKILDLTSVLKFFFQNITDIYKLMDIPLAKLRKAYCLAHIRRKFY